MTIPAFNERKASQLAAYLLSKSKNGELFLLKLMKLMYLVDREAMARLGRPVTFDQYVSMKHGPVLSNVLNLMNAMTRDREGHWAAMISARNGNKLRISDDCEVAFGALSEAELEIADQVYDEYAGIPRFELAELTHQLEEWKDPHGSAIPIRYEDIFAAVGYGKDEIEGIMEDLQTQHSINALFDTAQSECFERCMEDLKEA